MTPALALSAASHWAGRYLVGHSDKFGGHGSHRRRAPGYAGLSDGFPNDEMVLHRNVQNVVGAVDWLDTKYFTARQMLVPLLWRDNWSLDRYRQYAFEQDLQCSGGAKSVDLESVDLVPPSHPSSAPFCAKRTNDEGSMVSARSLWSNIVSDPPKESLKARLGCDLFSCFHELDQELDWGYVSIWARNSCENICSCHNHSTKLHK